MASINKEPVGPLALIYISDLVELITLLITLLITMLLY